MKIESPSSASSSVRKVVAGRGGAGSSSLKKEDGTALKSLVGPGGVPASKMEKWKLHLSTTGKEVGGLSEQECREVLRLARAGK